MNIRTSWHLQYLKCLSAQSLKSDTPWLNYAYICYNYRLNPPKTCCMETIIKGIPEKQHSFVHAEHLTKMEGKHDLHFHTESPVERIEMV